MEETTRLKYELTEETITALDGTVLHRIKALIDFSNIRAGDLGGFIEDLKNLDMYGDAWVSGDARVYGDARVSGNARVYGDAHEKSPLYIQGTRHAITVNSANLVQIGCHGYPLQRWLKSYKSVGKKERYSETEINEYGAYLHMIAKLLGVSTEG